MVFGVSRRYYKVVQADAHAMNCVACDYWFESEKQCQKGANRSVERLTLWRSRINFAIFAGGPVSRNGFPG